VERLAADSITPGDQPGTRQWHAIRHALPSRRHRRWAVPVAIAASLTGLIVAGALVRPRRVADTDAAAAPAAYVQASADLEAVLLEHRGSFRPETATALDAQLAVIDRAIAQAEGALAADPANDYVTRSVGHLRNVRLTVLRQAVAVATSRGL
jgi:hypothetical protein